MMLTLNGVSWGAFMFNIMKGLNLEKNGHNNKSLYLHDKLRSEKINFKREGAMVFFILFS